MYGLIQDRCASQVGSTQTCGAGENLGHVNRIRPSQPYLWGGCRLLPLVFLALVGAAQDACLAVQSYPMITGIQPLAIPVGQTSECEVTCQHNLYGAYQVFVSGDGVTAETPAVEPLPADGKKPAITKLKLKFTAAADAPLGIREYRVITPQGPSTIGNLVVVQDGITVESADNNHIAKPQPISLPATICGALDPVEDIDIYKFSMTTPTACTFQVYSARCQDQIHDLQTHSDPLLIVRDATGNILSLSDNSSSPDPTLHFRFGEPGDYFLEIRDARYQGNPHWSYCITAHARPFVAMTRPLRASPGVRTRLQLVGFNLPADPHAICEIPLSASLDATFVKASCGDEAAPIPTSVVVSRLPEMAEALADNDRAENAQPIGVPVGLSGCIERLHDVDCYAFDAELGEKFAMETVARRAGSSLDSIIRVRNAAGDRLLEVDDVSHHRRLVADSRVEHWVAPASGRYVIEVADLHGRGGPEYPYYLKIERSQPRFALELDTDKTLLAPGVTSMLYARVQRQGGFAGEVSLAVDHLPPGVTATCGRILADGTDGAILLHAAADAPRGAANVRVIGRAAHPIPNGEPRPLEAIGQPLQEIYMPGGGRHHIPVATHTAAVGDPLDVKRVTVNTDHVILRPGQSQRIDVDIERQEGFKDNVTLDLVYQHLGTVYGGSLPAGVTMDEANSKTLLTAEESRGHITIRADASAKPVERQLVPVMANVSINFVMKMTYCSGPFWITVAPNESVAAGP